LREAIASAQAPPEAQGQRIEGANLLADDTHPRYFGGLSALGGI